MKHGMIFLPMGCILLAAVFCCTWASGAESSPAWWLPQLMLESDVVAFGRVGDVRLERISVGSSDGVTFVTLEPSVVIKGGVAPEPFVFYLTYSASESGFVERNIPPLPSFAVGDTFMVFLERDACGELADRLIVSTEFKNGRARDSMAIGTGIVEHSSENWVELASILAEGQSARTVAAQASAMAFGRIVSVEPMGESLWLAQLDVERTLGRQREWRVSSFVFPSGRSAHIPDRPTTYPGPREVPTLEPGDEIAVCVAKSPYGGPQLIGGRSGVFLLDSGGELACMSPRLDLAGCLPEELRGVATNWEYECHSVEELVTYFEVVGGDSVVASPN